MIEIMRAPLSSRLLGTALSGIRGLAATPLRLTKPNPPYGGKYVGKLKVTSTRNLLVNPPLTRPVALCDVDAGDSNAEACSWFARRDGTCWRVGCECG